MIAGRILTLAAHEPGYAAHLNLALADTRRPALIPVIL